MQSRKSATPRGSAEQGPAESEARYRALVDNSPSAIIAERTLAREEQAQCIAPSYARSLIEANLDPLVTIDPGGKITDVNKATERATGVPRDRLIGTDFADYFSDPDAARAGYERVIREGEVRNYPLSLRSASGSLMDVEYNATAYRNEAGEVEGVFAAARDVTERKRAHEEAARLAAIVTSSEDAIFTKDLDEIVTNWNAGAESLYGYSVEEMIGKSVDLLKPPGREDDAGQLTKRIRQGERIVAFETLRMRKDGSLFDAASTLSPIRNDAGDITAISVIQRDITERRRADDERAARLRFAETMDRVNRAIQGASGLDRMMHDVLDVVLSSLECDRAWLFYPCDPDSPTFRVPMEVARPEYPGAGILNEDLPLAPDMAENLREALESSGPLTYLAGTERPVNKVTAEEFGVRSQMMVALHPKLGEPWVFGVHQCSHPRVWASEERRLFEEIGWRLTDALTSLLSQRDVREGAEKFSAAFDASPDMVVITRVGDGTILEVNEGYEKLLGYTRAESIGKTTAGLSIWADPADRVRFVSALEKAGQVTDFETTLRRKDGTSVPVTDSARTFVLQGRACILSVVRDITERKRVEGELESKNAILSTQQETSRDGILVVDEEARILSYNHRFVEMWHVPEDLVEAGIDEPILQHNAGQIADRQPFLERVDYLYQHRNETSQDELAFTDGRVFERYSASMFGPSEQYYGRVWYFRDITERKHAEAVIREEEAELEEAQRIGRFGNFDWDARTDTIVWSDEYYRIYGVDPKQKPPGYEEHLNVYGPESAARLDAAVNRSMQTGEPYELDLEQVRSDGTTRWVTARGEVKRDADGKLIGLRGTAQDITERKLAEQLAAQQARRIERTLTSVIDIASNIVELRDPYTAGHQRRVSELAVKIAESLGVSGHEIDDIRVAGLLHDMGKSGIPSEILSKPGVLSPLEFTLIESHAEAGYQLAVSANLAEPIAEMIYQHHERCDGSGYPRGLTGDQTLQGAKVLAVADVVEAMVSHRPYRPALGIKAALAEIERGTPTLYDGSVSEACIRLFNEEGFEFSQR